MSSILRLSSYGSSSAPPTTSHGHPRSPATPAPSPPSEAFPANLAPGTPKPSDVLINRAHEIKRIAKGLAQWFQSTAQAHHSHSITLAALSNPNKTPLPTPLQEASLFIPIRSTSSTSELGGTGNEGWQQILHEAKETNKRVAEAHAELASKVTMEVVGPLMKVRVEMKSLISLMEKEVQRLVDAVQKERDATAPLLTRLSLSLTQSSLPLSAPSLVPSEDPVLLRALLEAQLQKQVDKENELLACVKGWMGKLEEREREVWEQVKKCWAAWENANSSTLLNAQQHSMFLSATVDSLPSDAEWSHFLKLNHALLPDTPPKTIKDVVYDGKGDALTGVVMEGLLERQSSFLRSWKPAYFLLTPSGHLHVYPPPPASSSTATASHPSSSSNPQADSSDPSSPIPLGNGIEDSSISVSSASALPPLTPSATALLLHSTPYLSLNLALCTLGPMPTPSPESTAKSKKAALEPVFTVIEAVTQTGAKGTGTKHVIRCGGGPKKGEVEGEGEGWEEMGKWVGAISKFCSAPAAPPSPVLSATTTPTPSTDADAKRGSLFPPSSEQNQPPALPGRRPTPLGQSPALPSLPTSPLSEFGGPPPPLPPRESFAAGALPGQDGGEEDLEVDGGNRVRSSLIISDSGSDLPYDPSAVARHSLLASPPVSPSVERRLMDGLGMAGAGLVSHSSHGGEGAGARSPSPPPVPPHDTDEEEEEDESESSDAGDLGRSIRPSSAASSLRRQQQQMDQQHSPPPPVPSLPPVNVPRSGSVRSLAAAWEQNGTTTGGGAGSASGSLKSPPMGSGPKSPILAEEREEGEQEEESKALRRSLETQEIALHDNDETDGMRTPPETPRTPQLGDDGAEEKDDVDIEGGKGAETPSEPATPRSAGKKGKKKRKSKGGAAANGNKPTERPLPLPSIDPEHADLSLSLGSPHSPAFDLSVPDEGPLGVEVERRERDEEGEGEGVAK
ncbi:hypothetical protein JCM11251_002572 [Rhodosporidiobolus azoricus]